MKDFKDMFGAGDEAGGLSESDKQELKELQDQFNQLLADFNHKPKNMNLYNSAEARCLRLGIATELTELLGPAADPGQNRIEGILNLVDLAFELGYEACNEEQLFTDS